MRCGSTPADAMSRRTCRTLSGVGAVSMRMVMLRIQARRAISGSWAASSHGSEAQCVIVGITLPRSVRVGGQEASEHAEAAGVLGVLGLAERDQEQGRREGRAEGRTAGDGPAGVDGVDVAARRIA